MERLRRYSTTASLLLVTLFGLPLLTPLLRWTAVPCTHDGHLHYHRVVAMRHAWENGLLAARWLPDLAFGYGYPFFVYREPAPLVAVLLPHLAGLPLPAASNLFYALTILACGWFMFLWVRDVLDARAALVSAVAYMAAPYVLVDALVRGNSPESLALPLLPLLLWAGRRWLLGRQARFFLTAVFALALLSLSHNISTLIFTPTLLVYLLVVGRVNRLAWPALAARIGLLLGLGLGMTIFYTGGALLEMDQVTLQQSTTTRNNDFRYNFATLGEILAPVAPEDPQLVNPPLPFRLGWTVVGLALAGLGVGIWDLGFGTSERGERRWHVVLMAIGTAVYLLMALAVSRPLWEGLPLIDFVQFPWRFVGRAALPLAFLAGVPFVQRPAAAGARRVDVGRYLLPAAAGARRVDVGRYLLPAAIALLVLETLPNLYPNVCPEAAFPDITAVHTYERVTGLVGVDPEGSYFPRTVAQRPAASPLEADYQAGRPPQRFDAAALPDGAALHAVAYAPLGVTVELTTPAPFTARYLSFAFPGWTAAVDGAAVPITPGDPDGLITFPVPAGTHTVTVAWRSTPLRTALLTASALALLAALAAATLLARSPAPQPPRSPAPPLPRTPHPAPHTLALLALLLLGLKLAVDRVPNPLRRPAAPPVAQPLQLWGGELRLEGYTLSRTAVPSGATVDVDMAWTAVSPPTVDYQTNVWLAGPDGLIWSAKGTERPRLYEDAPPTRLWAPGQWGWDSREVQLFAGTPPGVYDLVLTLFDRATLQPVTLRDAAGAVVGPTAVLGQIEVTPPAAPPDFAPQYPLTADFPALGVRLLGYNQDRAAAAPGEQVLLTLFWERLPGAAADDVTVQLLAAGGTAQSWALPLPAAADDWQPGARLRGQHVLRLPAALDSGEVRFALPDGVQLAPLQITAPARLLERPAVETAVDQPFAADGAPVARLAGYTVELEETAVGVTLVWQALAEMPVSYRVFVHLVDDAGQLLAQADGEPAAWTRPTTGWMPGEFVVDAHTLSLPADLPPGAALRIGLYDPDTGRRLLAETADFVTIPLR